MNEDNIADLKQFISATVSQNTSDVLEEVKKLKRDVYKIDARVDELIRFVVRKLE